MIYIFLTFVVYQPFKDLLLNVENSKLLYDNRYDYVFFFLFLIQFCNFIC